jgi:hypothetical protein
MPRSEYAQRFAEKRKMISLSQNVTKPRRVTGWLGGSYPEATLTRKVSHPQASELCWRRWVGENPQLSNKWSIAMSNRGPGAAETVIPIPLAPKLHPRAEAGDQLDRAGQTIMGALNRAATTIEASYRQPVEMSRRLATQLRAAEERIAELEVKAHFYEDRADRAEKWLYQISLEIEQKFLGRDADNSQPPQVVSQSQRG